MFNSVTPIRNEILVRLLDPDTKVGDLYLPETRRDDSRCLEGIVMKCGPGCKDPLARGTRVLLPRYTAAVVKIDKMEYRLVKDDALLAIIEEDV